MHAAVVFIFSALYCSITWVSHFADEHLDFSQCLVIPILPWISFACPLVHIATVFWSYIAGQCTFSSLEKIWGLGWCYFPPENIFISLYQVPELSSNFRPPWGPGTGLQSVWWLPSFQVYPYSWGAAFQCLIPQWDRVSQGPRLWMTLDSSFFKISFKVTPNVSLQHLISCLVNFFKIPC